MDNDCVIATQNLTRRYGPFHAVSGLNLGILRHRVTGFLGRNGAGKSTTIRMLLGMTRPSEGSGTVLGRRIDNAKDSCEIRRRVAFIGEEKQLYDYMTVQQLIRFTASFYPDWQPDKAERLQRQYQLPLTLKAGELSKGMRSSFRAPSCFCATPGAFHSRRTRRWTRPCLN